MENDSNRDIHEAWVSEVLTAVRNIPLSDVAASEKEKKNNPLLVANEIVKTRDELALKEAEILQKDRDQEQKDRELDQRDRELDQRDKEISQKSVEQNLKKQENLNEVIKVAAATGVSLASIAAMVKVFMTTLKAETEGVVLTGSVGRSILNMFKIIK